MKTSYKILIKNILLIFCIICLDRVFLKNSIMYVGDSRHIAEVMGLLHKLMYWAGVIYLANSRWISIRLFSGIFFAIFIYIDEVFKNITGGVMSVPDMDMVLMSTALWKEAFVFYAPYIFDFKTIFFVGLFLFLFIWYPKEKEKTNPFIEFFMQMGIVSIFIVNIFSMPHDSNEFLDMYMPFVRIPGEYFLVKSNPINTNRNELEERPVSSPKIKNIILVIDESVRADFGGVNLETWSTYKDDLIDYGKCYSSINCSYGSRSYLRFASTPEDILNKSALSQPTIWQYAKKAGFKSYLIGYTPLKDNLLTNKEVEEIDYFEHMSLDEYRPYYDVELAKKIKQKIRENEGNNFFYVSKEGVHFPYEDSYPKEKAYFKPHLEYKESMINATKTKNSYKNALKWSVESFFDELLSNKEIDLAETIIIYTSDHGEYLNEETNYDNFIPQTHCSVVDPKQEEFEVPLIIFTKNNELKDLLSKDQGASHFHIMPTIKKLMGYNVKDKNLFDVELGNYPSFYGDPYGRFEKIKVFRN